ncbi:MAG TPA: hypothetical protein VMS21_07145, partial [Methylomirabilota bacterium]|nr:hypothetical protein [Methylomirabilota bacterium]
MDISAINNAASGLGYVATITYELNDDVFNSIVKLSPGGSLDWSYQVNNPAGGAFLRLTREDRVVVATYDGNTDKTEFSQFNPDPDGGEAALEFSLEASGNVRTSDAFRFLDGKVYSLSVQEGKVQLARHGPTGELEQAREYSLQTGDGAVAVDMSEVRLHELPGAVLMTSQSPGSAEGLRGRHFAKINRDNLSLAWTTHYELTDDDATVFQSSRTRGGKNMFFANNAGLNAADHVRIASLNLMDGTLTGGVVFGANRNPPAALFADWDHVLVMGYRDQAGENNGRYLTAFWANHDLQDLTGMEFHVLDSGTHTYRAAGFSYPGRFNLEFQTQYPGIPGSQSWVGAFDLTAPEEGNYWFNNAAGSMRHGGYRFEFGKVPFYQYRDLAEQRLEVGHVHERLGIGTERFELLAPSYNFRRLDLTYAPFDREPLEDRVLLEADVNGGYVPPLSLTAVPKYSLVSFPVEVTHSNVGATPEITIDNLHFEDTGTEKTVTSRLVATQGVTIVLGQRSEVDGRTRLVGHRTVLDDVPILTHSFKF